MATHCAILPSCGMRWPLKGTIIFASLQIETFKQKQRD